MARDALTNDEFRAAAALLAETGDLKKVARLHPHIDPIYFSKNAEALHKAAGVVPPAGDETAAEKKAEAKADAAAERKAEKVEEAKEDAAAFRHPGRK